MDFPVRFGKYELLDRIAMGGMAEVFLARESQIENRAKNLLYTGIRPVYIPADR